MARGARGLGKGLDALFQDNSTEEASSAVQVRLSEIEPNRNQPRKQFDDAALSELADSIKTHGVIQPLLVRPLSNGTYQLIAGERRWRASRMVGLSEIPVIIKEMSDKEAMEIALVENLQREDLNPMEEARGYRELMENYDLTQDDIAQRVGKSRPAVANVLRLLNLPEEVADYIAKGEISAGHARAILSLDKQENMIIFAKEIIAKKLNVRESEKIAKKLNNSTKNKNKKPTVSKRDTFYDEMEIALNSELHRKVKIEVKENKGRVIIDFYDRSELSDIAERLTNK